MGVTRLEIANNVRENLGDAGITWYSVIDINDSIQDGYNLLSAVLCPIQKTTFFPLLARPYYHFTDYISNLFSIQGIYNPITNLWLEYTSVVEMSKWRWDVERWNGQACFWTPISFRTTMIAPWNPIPTGAIYLAYIAKANILQDNSVPNIPVATKTLLENYSTYDLLEQAREFKKAATYVARFKEELEISKEIVKNLARTHRMRVMEPWNPLGRYSGKGYSMNIINDETPVGDIDGTNDTYTLAVPPNPSSSLGLFKNGQLLIQDVAYTLTGSEIIINTDYICTTGEYLRAWYQLS